VKQRVKIGIDLGGTKIAVVALSPSNQTLFSNRLPTPKGNYQGVLETIHDLVNQAKKNTGADGEDNVSIGIGIPGSVSPQTNLIQNANSTWMNTKPFQSDIERTLDQSVKLANDANCLALSESFDGAAKGAGTVFGVIIGTGCGGGLIVNGKLIEGRHAICGEWGHTPLPWLKADEFPGPPCWCGQNGCIETWVSGTGMEQAYQRTFGQVFTAQNIVDRASDGNKDAQACLDMHADRLARGLALITNLYDPDVIVLGGGLSNMSHLYEQLPFLMKKYVFADAFDANIKKPVHGDASGVRGAARLWD